MLLKNLIYISLLEIILFFLINKISLSFNLLDYPLKRKIHKKAVPYTGGVVLGFIYLLFVFFTDYNIRFINLTLSFSFLVMIFGFFDDRFNLKPGTKIILQIISIYILIQEGLYLLDLGTYEGYGVLKLGSFDKIFSIMCCLLLINSINYNDGVDGLASTIFIILITSFSLICLIEKDVETSKYLVLLNLPVIIFLFFNFNIFNFPKIFLGDSGSNMLGFTITFISIGLYVERNIHPAIIIWPLAYLVYEFFSLNLIRLIKKKGMFNPGLDHLHHILLKKKLGSLSVNIIIPTISLLISILGIFSFYNFGATFSLILFLIMLVIYTYVRIKII